MRFYFLLMIHVWATTPEWNQQCADDAGPPFIDDRETFPNAGRYHDANRRADPVLQADGTCAGPMKEACRTQDAKTAYLEGPISCGNDGWFCRIIPYEDQNDWPNVSLRADVNAAHCNTTEAIADHGYDAELHCHGSDKASTYYWWVRDHWFRQYNGHLRCCCGWANQADTQTANSLHLGSRRVVNRCDYRKEIENDPVQLEQCRDANEEHTQGWDDIGCHPDTGVDGPMHQVNKPIPEDDATCWEVRYFGHVEGGDNDEDNASQDADATDDAEENNGGEDQDQDQGGDEEDGEGSADQDDEDTNFEDDDVDEGTDSEGEDASHEGSDANEDEDFEAEEFESGENFESAEEGFESEENFESAEEGFESEENFESGEEGFESEENFESGEEGFEPEENFESGEEGFESEDNFESGEEGFESEENFESESGENLESDEDGSESGENFESDEEGFESGDNFESESGENFESDEDGSESGENAESDEGSEDDSWSW